MITVHPTPDGANVEIRISQDFPIGSLDCPPGYLIVVLTPEQAEDLRELIHRAAYLAKYEVR